MEAVNFRGENFVSGPGTSSAWCEHIRLEWWAGGWLCPEPVRKAAVNAHQRHAKPKRSVFDDCSRQRIDNGADRARGRARSILRMETDSIPFCLSKKALPACPFATVRRPLYGEAKVFLARIMGMIARLPGPVQVALACPTNEHEITLANGSTIESLPLGPGILSPSARW